MNIFQLVTALQQTNSLNEKQAVLKNADDTSKHLLFLTYNNFINFRIGKSILSDDLTLYNTQSGSSLEPFTAIASVLSSVSSINNNLRDMTRKVLETYTYEEAIVLQNVLMKDLRVGLSAKTINKVFKDFIPVFDVMLCNKYRGKTIDKFLKNTKTILLQPKLDGNRVVVKYDRGDKSLSFMSRSGKEVKTYNQQIVNDLTAIFTEYDASLENHPVLKECANIWIDGEIMAGVFTEGMVLDRNKHILSELMKTTAADSEEKNNNVYYIFSTFLTNASGALGTCSELTRYNILRNLDRDYDNVRFVPTEIIKVTDKTKEYIDNYYNQCLSKSYEGSIVKDADCQYELKRTNTWLKVKPEEDADLTLVKMTEGEGKFVGMCGSIYLEGEIEINGEMINVTGECGSGFSDEMRQYLWDNQAELIGKTIEIKYMEVTHHDSIRHAKFVKIRDDK